MARLHVLHYIFYSFFILKAFQLLHFCLLLDTDLFTFIFCAGMMWMRQFSNSDMNLRHTCEQGDHLQGYGWLMHDGLTFGVQEIRDNDFTLTTEFVKRIGGDHGGDWTWRITAKQHVSCS